MKETPQEAVLLLQKLKAVDPHATLADVRDLLREALMEDKQRHVLQDHIGRLYADGFRLLEQRMPDSPAVERHLNRLPLVEQLEALMLGHYMRIGVIASALDAARRVQAMAMMQDAAHAAAKQFGGEIGTIKIYRMEHPDKAEPDAATIVGITRAGVAANEP